MPILRAHELDGFQVRAVVEHGVLVVDVVGSPKRLRHDQKVRSTRCNHAPARERLEDGAQIQKLPVLAGELCRFVVARQLRV